MYVNCKRESICDWFADLLGFSLFNTDVKYELISFRSELHSSIDYEGKQVYTINWLLMEDYPSPAEGDGLENR